jgi:hypothetical protein
VEIARGDDGASLSVDLVQVVLRRRNIDVLYPIASGVDKRIGENLLCR